MSGTSGRHRLAGHLAWATVCFQDGAPPSGDAGHRAVLHDHRSGAVSVVWRSDTGHGTALVSWAPGASSARCADHTGRFPCDVHLWADPDLDLDPLCRAVLAECADVLVGHVPLPPFAASRQVSDLLVRYPGCLVAAVPTSGIGGAVVGVRDPAGEVGFVSVGCEDTGAAGAHLVAAVTHAWITAGRASGALRSVTPVAPVHGRSTVAVPP